MKPAFFRSRYYLKFGLDRDPFPQNSAQHKLFLTHELTHLMDEVLASIKSGDEVLVVESAPGGGKSVLAAYLNYIKEANWYLSLIRASTKMGRAELAHAIISQHFPNHRFDLGQSDTLLHDFLQLYQRNGKVPVVVIDDAHLLTDDTLKFVLEIANLNYEGAQFRMVLLGDSSIARQLTRPSLNKPDTAGRIHYQIPAFSQVQTGKYLEHRLSLSGDADPMPFDIHSIEQIYKNSSGIPGEINRLAKRHMRDFVIPGRVRKILVRSGASIAAGLLLFISVYAGMSGGNWEADTNSSVSVISLTLPDSGMQTKAGKGKLTSPVQLTPAKPVVKNRKNIEKNTLIAKQLPIQNNRQVLRADMKRQRELRAKKSAEIRAKAEMRLLLARYDNLALRVSDVLHN